ncbi:MAG: MFS transporter [Verrucomicrobia bacterium]|nr:MFS transporter [Verrucomicrobiota bacterium]
MSKSRKVAWMVWVIVSVFYAYQYVLRVMPKIMLHDIMDKFDMDATIFGQFSGIYYISYSLMHLPMGIMLDRYGPKKVMSGSIFLTALGLLSIVFTNHWIFPVVGRFLIGLGSSAAILGIFKVVRMVFSEKRFSLMLSFSVTIGLLGALFGGGPVQSMYTALGYESVIEIFSFAGVVLALITYLIVPDIKSASETGVIYNVKEVLKNKKVIGICLFAGLMVGPLEGFADIWSDVFLRQVYGLDQTLASFLPSLVFFGMCGAPILSVIAEKIGNYFITIIGAAVVMAGSFFLLLFVNLNPVVLGVSFTLVGVCSAYQILAIYKASTYVKEEVAGLTTACANMIIMVFGYAFHTVIGNLVGAFGGPSNSFALIIGVSVIPIALCLGGAGFTLLYRQDKKLLGKAL